ncbi:MAG: C25 family cysteine peptidase, partial [Dehalococcoidia bacterium]|nr:C25 family cysteine peptidase [Dehalococcoidia bacterium]
MPLPPGVQAQYQLRVVEVLPGQTEEEALSSNPPWFEQSRITSTTLTYPIRAKKLVANKRYGWQVVATVGRVRLASGKRSFILAHIPKKPVQLQCLTVERRVERETNYFKVFLDVKVPADVEGADIAATSSYGTRTRWKGGRPGATAKGATFTLEFHAVPILWSEELGWWWNEPYRLCDSVVITYKYNGNYYVRQPDLSFQPCAEVGAAIAAADFIIVTCPKRLYAFYDDNEVHELLMWCGKLAQTKTGVLGYLEAATSGYQLKSMLDRGGFWGKLLAPVFRTWAGGYVLLVGEHNIVPSWIARGLKVPWSGGDTTTQVRLTDFPYSDCTGDWVVDLKVGRAIGRSGAELSRMISSTLFAPHMPHKACLISGYD